MHAFLPFAFDQAEGVAVFELLRTAGAWEVRMTRHTVVGGRAVSVVYQSDDKSLTDSLDGAMTDLQWVHSQLVRVGAKAPPPPPSGNGGAH